MTPWACETMWRCATCGKWSHAKRKPTQHQRWVPDDGRISVEAFEAFTIIATYEAEYDFDGEPMRNGGWMVRCGPFVKYVATSGGTDG